MRFGAEKAIFSFVSRRGSTPVSIEHGRQVKGVTGDDMDGRGIEIAHQLDLPLAVARPGGDHQRPDLLGPVVETEPSREETVGHHVLEDVRAPHPGHVHRTREEVRPGGDVAFGVKDNRGPAGRPG
jgi:hypothetical protein